MFIKIRPYSSLQLFECEWPRIHEISIPVSLIRENPRFVSLVTNHFQTRRCNAKHRILTSVSGGLPALPSGGANGDSRVWEALPDDERRFAPRFDFAQRDLYCTYRGRLAGSIICIDQSFQQDPSNPSRLEW